MIERYLIESLLLGRVRYGQLKIEYWDGVRHYGTDGPTLTVRVTKPKVVRRLVWGNPSLAFGEGYMRGEIEVPEDQLYTLFWLIARNQPPAWLRRPHRFEPNQRRRQRSQVGRHYNVGNDYYRLWL